MNNVANALLNMILVSIPEETFIVVMTLIFLKRFDLLDVRMWRHNIKWIVIPVLPMVIMINVLRYIVIIPKPTITLMGYILMNILMIYIMVKNSYEGKKKLILKTILFTFLSFVIVVLAESIYIPITLSLVDKPIAYFNNNVFYNFMLALPGRVFEYSICAYIVVKKNNYINIDMFNSIIKSRFLYVSFLTLIIFSNAFILYFTKLIGFDNILQNLRIIEQLIIIVISISFPIVSITLFLLIINFFLVRQKQIQQTYESLVIQDDVMCDVDN